MANQVRQDPHIDDTKILLFAAMRYGRNMPKSHDRARILSPREGFLFDQYKQYDVFFLDYDFRKTHLGRGFFQAEANKESIKE